MNSRLNIPISKQLPRHEQKETQNKNQFIVMACYLTPVANTAEMPVFGQVRSSRGYFAARVQAFDFLLLSKLRAVGL